MKGLPDFKRLMSARFFFTLGVQVQAVVLGWRMYELTRSPLYLGFVGLAEAIPALSLALYAGYVVDRSRPLRIYRGVILASLLSGLVLLASGDRIGALFLSSLLTGVARGFSQPALYATVPRIVPRERLSEASAWTSSVMQLARISGPALGGMIFGWAGVTAAATCVCAFLALAFAAVLLIQADPLPPARTGAPVSVREELLSGAVFVFRHPILLSALSLDMISVLFGGVTALLPIFAVEILGVGPGGLGALRAAPAVGAIAMGILLTRWDVRPRAGRWLLGSVAGFGLSMLAFGLSGDFRLSLAALALGGAFDSVSMIIRGSAVQLASPDSMRGKISAVNSIFIGSSNELGEFESGVAAKLFGAVPAVLLGAGVCLVTVMVVAIASPTLRKLDLRDLRA